MNSLQQTPNNVNLLSQYNQGAMSAPMQHPFPNTSQQQIGDQTMMRMHPTQQLQHSPLHIRVACESPDCEALLEVHVPDEVRVHAPQQLVIRCASCSRLLQVYLPPETYAFTPVQNTNKSHQEELLELMRLQNEIQMKKESLMAMISQHGSNMGGAFQQQQGGSQQQQGGSQQQQNPNLIVQNMMTPVSTQSLGEMELKGLQQLQQEQQQGGVPLDVMTSGKKQKLIDINATSIPTPESGQRNELIALKAGSEKESEGSPSGETEHI